MKKPWAREEALLILSSVIRDKAYSNIALKKGLSESKLIRVDKALVTEIVYGTLKNLIRIDWIIKQFIKLDKKKLDPMIEDILRCGVYQIIFLDRVPDSAVCNECSELGRKYGHEGTVKFINGVLRNIGRNKNIIKYPNRDNKLIEFLSVYYSYPVWIVKRWIKEFGAEFCEKLLAAGNELPDYCIRINTLKTKKQELIELLEDEGIEVYQGRYNAEALYIRGTSSIEDKNSFQRGYYQIQDESSMLVAHILDPNPGEFIIDVCSAPGGKATHIAQLMNNEGTIISRDIYEHKMKLIKNSADRLGIKIIRSEVYDALVFDEKLTGKADRVLIDAPCSGLGIVRRKPDLKYNSSPNDLKELQKLQLQILINCSRYVKDSGILVYSTCTINADENYNLIKKFLNDNEQFYMEDISDLLPENLRQDSAKNGYIQLYPNRDGIDGFFIARIRRK